MSNIYNSRNYIGLLNLGICIIRLQIYNSRNYIGLLNLRSRRKTRHIYNSRNYIGLLNRGIDTELVTIYNSRNYIGLLNGLQKLADYQQRGIFILGKTKLFLCILSLIIYSFIICVKYQALTTVLSD